MATNKLKNALREHKVFCVESKKKKEVTNINEPEDNGKKNKKKHPSKMKATTEN